MTPGNGKGLLRDVSATRRGRASGARGGMAGRYTLAPRGRGGVSRMPTTFLISFAGALPGPTPLLSIRKPFSCSCIL